jgi:hypothetical protein
MFEELLLKEPCSIAVCELMQKAPYLALILGFAAGVLLGYGSFFRKYHAGRAGRVNRMP